MADHIPGYVNLLRAGELAERVSKLEELLSPCTLCPFNCRVDRRETLGRCSTGLKPVVASHTQHFGEEPVISGTHGSGTIFMANCNLRCVFCQNHEISQRPNLYASAIEDPEALAERMLRLQEAGCHNINWVSPTHQSAQLLSALLIAAEKGLHLPIVYNSNGYDSVEVLKLLDDIVDIYMPDLKYADDSSGEKYSRIPDYAERAREALTEIFRQVGDKWERDGGILTRGLLIRLLVLPGGISGTVNSLHWIAENLSPRVGVSLMSQYHPAHRAADKEFSPVLGRKVSATEWREVVKAHTFLMPDGKGYVQDMKLSPNYYQPDFSDPEKPFPDSDKLLK